MSAESIESYTNPVIPGFHPDPSICRVGDTFYLVTSSFEYFPGLPLFESKDLVSWNQIGHCLTRPTQLDLTEAGSSQGVFAPTIRWNAGIFYVTATNVSGGGHFIVHTDDPHGEWSDPVWVDQNGIDPSLFFEDDIAYFQSNVEPNPGGVHELEPEFERGIQQCVVDPRTGQRLTPTQFLWAGSGGRFPEAPHLYKRRDFYYLVAAEGGTERGHMVTMARSRSPWGPFESSPNNPVLSHRSIASPIQSTGHADLVELEDGSWWAVLLGTRPVREWHHLGRETFLIPVTWTDDGWPILGDNGRVLKEHRRPFPTASVDVGVEPDSDTFFRSGSLLPEWNALRVPREASFSADERPGWLLAHGSIHRISDLGLTFLGRRQQDFTANISVLVDAPNGTDEAGLVVRMDEFHHSEVFVSDREGRRCVVYRRQVDTLVTEEIRPAPPGIIKLAVAANELSYEFSFESSDGKEVFAPKASARYVSTEVAGGFTGVFIGVFVVGAESTASFAAFEYRADRREP
jgi:alpha-N-arabinofuranosidase